jgi:chromatin remodeling complex protein RSC6
MPPAAKKTATVVETPAVVVPPVVQEKVEKKVKKAAPAKVAEPEPVAATPIPAVTKDEVAAVPDEENAINSLVDKVASLAALIKEVQASIKPVFKEYERQRKIIERIQKKRDNARNSPSGFAKPNKISNELCDFIGVPHGTEKSRTDITRHINAYVKEHNLNKPTNRRVIIPDDKLKAILKINEGEEVTFFILQRLISHHFPPKKTTA